MTIARTAAASSTVELARLSETLSRREAKVVAGMNAEILPRNPWPRKQSHQMTTIATDASPGRAVDSIRR
jgi:hypothetical protein